jgi:quercetin 2,3-dioxygenase
MIEIRKSSDRGHFDHGWLDTYHTFSFAEYYDPRFTGFRQLRVINEDRVAPGMGFGTHPHRDMEIITYVLSGALEHKDSLGNGTTIRPGEVQRMTAGTGVTHSEFNPSTSEPVHLLQIWIKPEQKGLPPSYEQKLFPEDEKRGSLRLIASRDGRDGSVTIRQDVDLYATVLEPGEAVSHELADGRYAWIQVIEGRIDVNGHSLEPGDGASVSEEQTLQITATDRAELLLFDLN